MENTTVTMYNISALTEKNESCPVICKSPDRNYMDQIYAHYQTGNAADIRYKQIQWVQRELFIDYGIR